MVEHVQGDCRHRSRRLRRAIPVFWVGHQLVQSFAQTMRLAKFTPKVAGLIAETGNPAGWINVDVTFG